MLNQAMTRWLNAPWAIIVTTLLLIKVSLAWALPMTGDEAYFVFWGRYLDYGYYDHPPMAGWMMWLQLLVSDHRVWLRMPGLLSELIIAWAFYQLMQPFDAVKARWLALLLLLSPISLLNVFTLTDTGCILFAALSFVAAARGLLTSRLLWAALAGVGLGLAFLSKYFSVLLGIGYLIFYFAVAPAYWRHGVVLVLAAIPFGLLNLHWNLMNCWSNLLFNLVNRNEDSSGVQWAALVSYVVMMAYVLLPPVIRGLYQVRSQVAEATIQPILRLAATLAGTALLGFLLVSLGKNIGLHWVLWFHPFCLLLLWRLPLARWQQITRQISWYGVAHVLIVLLIVAMPLSVWSGKPKLQRDILAAYEGEQILVVARAKAAELTAANVGQLALATQGYTASSVLSYLAREPVMVMGTGSKYARQDDFITDFRHLDGESVLLFLKRPREVETAAPWFAEYQLFQVEYKGLTFDFLLGQGFDYAVYKDIVLTEVRDNYYRFPDWLPDCRCDFVSRYFGEADGVAPDTTGSPQK